MLGAEHFALHQVQIFNLEAEVHKLTEFIVRIEKSLQANNNADLRDVWAKQLTSSGTV